jgi:hypothetical protein
MIKTSNSNLSNRPSPKPKHWLLAKSRQWHLWGGLIAGLFIIVVATTGIVLNYKRPIFTALGLEQMEREKGYARETKDQPAKPEAAQLTATVSPETTAQVMARALELARTEWGDVPLERIELKEEHGELLCKVKEQGGDELWLYPATGSHFIKGEYEKIGKPGADGKPAKQFDWGKLMLNLHTGKIGGETGKAIMSLASVMLLFLTGSGVYLWAKPLLIRRRNARARQSPAVGAPVPAPVVPTFAPEPARVTLAAAQLSETR